ncbi:uncharacterized protein [Drosophila suzukii]|uniref:Uncharacterized protein n=1 Tax=Drosophila suzukii TaxID=28584 RepID=A0AB39Z395_DROSZ
MVDAKPNSESFMQNVLEIFSESTSTKGQWPMVSSYFCPFLMLIIWIASFSILICICVCCKFVKSETFTSYDSNSIEMQEVRILEPNFKHFKRCACLECLHRQLAKELDMKSVN